MKQNAKTNGSIVHTYEQQQGTLRFKNDIAH